MRVAFVTILCLVAPTLVAADPAPPREVPALVAGDCARARQAGKTCVLDLPAEVVTGEPASGDGIGVHILGFGTKASLIRLRRDFFPEIVKTAESL